MKTVDLVKDAANCSACGACLTVCPKRAITMETNAYGCAYPTINEDACIQCGKCMQICEYQKPDSGAMPHTAYAAVGNNDDLVQNSASGGVFATLAKCCIDDGGMVAGAVMDCRDGIADVYHVLSNRIEDVVRMQGSKYVQSQAWRCYLDVQKAVQSGKTVLFSGTPCQVAAVKSLTGDPENLITMDLICHGVPPLQMLNDYLKILGKRVGGVITRFQFRDKSCNKNFCAKINVDTKRNYRLRSQYLSFYKYFLEGSIYRENCYSCPYASLQRISDITVGDYWGIEKFHSAQISSGEMPLRKDWSCVLVNTDKGKHFLETYQHQLLLWPTKAVWVAENNRQLNAPSFKSTNRQAILRNYVQGGYAAIESAFMGEHGGKLRYYWRMLKNLRR